MAQSFAPNTFWLVTFSLLFGTHYLGKVCLMEPQRKEFQNMSMRLGVLSDRRGAALVLFVGQPQPTLSAYLSMP